MSRIRVYAGRYHLGGLPQLLHSRTIDESESLPKGYYYTESEALVALREKEKKRYQEMKAAEPAIREALREKAKQVKEVLGDNYYLSFDSDSGNLHIWKDTPFGIFAEDL